MLLFGCRSFEGEARRALSGEAFCPAGEIALREHALSPAERGAISPPDVARDPRYFDADGCGEHRVVACAEIRVPAGSGRSARYETVCGVESIR
jgi:hypothetical protein